MTNNKVDQKLIKNVISLRDQVWERKITLEHGNALCVISSSILHCQSRILKPLNQDI